MKNEFSLSYYYVATIMIAFAEMSSLQEGNFVHDLFEAEYVSFLERTLFLLLILTLFGTAAQLLRGRLEFDRSSSTNVKV